MVERVGDEVKIKTSNVWPMWVDAEELCCVYSTHAGLSRNTRRPIRDDSTVKLTGSLVLLVFMRCSRCIRPSTLRLSTFARFAFIISG